MADLREQAVGLFRYLNALVQLRTKTIYDVSDYPSVYWFDELPYESGCHTRAWGQDGEIHDDVWLEVKKPTEPRCPPIPATVEGWVDPETVADSIAEPQLYERRLVPTAEEAEESAEAEAIEVPVFEELSGHPEVQRAWRRYIEQKWLPWSEDHRRWEGIQSSYSALFGIHQSIQRLGEEYELAVGLGYLSWRPPDGREVKRHVLTIRASIEFDANRGVLTVRPGVDGAGVRIELDMLSPTYQPEATFLRELEQSLESDGHDPWDRAFVDSTIRSLVQSMVGGRGTYDGELSRHEGVSDSPRATLAPALILRKRSGLTMRAALEKIITDLQSDENAPIPKGIRGVCDINDDGRARDVLVDGRSPVRTGSWNNDGVLFPLPTNKEQATIADALTNRNGVLVQGPPGTGKSHTIVNLICHLLADGKRILVTAQTPRALKVLQDKLRELAKKQNGAKSELASLCVSVLGNDRAALEDLKAAVTEISRRHSQWDPAVNREEIERLRESLRRERERLAELRGKLRELREIETRVHEVVGGVYSGTAQRIAMRVAEEAARFVWFKDEIGATDELPFGTSTFLSLREAFVRIDKSREAEVRRERPEPSLLPPPEQLSPLFKQEESARRRMEEHAEYQEDERYHRLREATKRGVMDVRDALRGLQAAVRTIEQRPLPWIKQAVYDILTGHDTPWKTLRDTTTKGLDGLSERAALSDNVSLSGPGKYGLSQLLADARDLKEHFDRGKGLGWWVFRSKLVKRIGYLAESVVINGRSCDNAPALAQLIEHLQTVQTIHKVWSLWKGKAESTKEAFSLQVANLEEHLEALNSVIGIEKHLERSKAACQSVTGLGECAWHEPDAVVSLAQCCEAVLAGIEYGESKRIIDEIEDKLAQVALRAECHPTCREVCDAVRQTDLEAYARAADVLKELEHDAALLRQREEWASQLGRLAPSLARGISETAADAIWDERLPQIGQAWSWARAKNWLIGFFGDGDEARLGRTIKGSSDKEANLTAQLCEQKAWWHFFERMTEPQRKYLIAAVGAMQKIGGGKGRHAARYRREAQEYVQQCRGAIPAWVMPLYRIYETMQPEPEMFDVVIVDEASQCGPDSLVLLYLADKIVIVGDNKQISPEAVGVNRDDVVQLINQYLTDIPMKETFDVTSSLYQRGLLQYGHPIALREHFRCVPEIIRFSNDLSYRDEPLVPLRQYPPERLQPIVVRHVPTGYREGEGAKVINRPEAEALVEAVVACCNDPRYEGMTMGVISLQAETQARLIESLLAERLDAKEINQRRLLCGDAYSFQGDERDVIFMSMVAAPNTRIGALVTEAHQRRFNVAASRARDQVWLFHTAKLADLNPKGLRYQLLNYYLHPETQQITPEGVNVDELRVHGRDVRRDQENAPHPFESWFEVDVFLSVTARGYRVIPQFRVAGYRIDLVVEGLRNRLAVECDGDEHHGIERFEADQHRQRTLERCGWHFWRVRGSVFYANQEEALTPLWTELERLGIKPISAESEAGGLATGYVPDMPLAACVPVTADEQEEGVEEKEAEEVEAVLPLRATETADEATTQPTAGPDAPIAEHAQGPNEEEEGAGRPESAATERRAEKGVVERTDSVEVREARKRTARPREPDQEMALIAAVEAEGSDVWHSLSHWAKINGQFDGWQRSLLYNIGKCLHQGIPVTLKQARQAMKLLEEAQEHGFEQAQ